MQVGQGPVSDEAHEKKSSPVEQKPSITTISFSAALAMQAARKSPVEREPARLQLRDHFKYYQYGQNFEPPHRGKIVGSWVPKRSAQCVAWSIFGYAAGLTEFFGFGAFVGVSSVPSFVQLCQILSIYKDSWIKWIEPLFLTNGFFSGLAMMMVVLNFSHFLGKVKREVQFLKSTYQVSNVSIGLSLAFCTLLWGGLSFAPLLGLHQLDNSKVIHLETSTVAKAILGVIFGIGNFAVWAMLHAKHVVQAPVNLRSLKLFCSRQAYEKRKAKGCSTVVLWGLKSFGNCFVYSARLSYMIVLAMSWLAEIKPSSPSMVSVGLVAALSAIYNTFFTQSLAELMGIFPKLQPQPRVPAVTIPAGVSVRRIMPNFEQSEPQSLTRFQRYFAAFLVMNVCVSMTLSTMTFAGSLSSRTETKVALYLTSFLSCVLCILPQFVKYVSPQVAQGIAYHSELFQSACITAYPQSASDYKLIAFYRSITCCRRKVCKLNFAPVVRDRFKGLTIDEMEANVRGATPVHSYHERGRSVESLPTPQSPSLTGV